jgi:hypothetical protein
VRYPLSEILDRRSILLLKIERGPRDEAVKRAADALWAAAFAFGYRDVVAIVLWAKRLKEINGKIWDLEAGIRRGAEGELGLEEVGRRALQIRDLNRIRVGLKNEVAHAVGEFEEPKIDHASQADAAA